jgi:hypothetical protein
MHTPYDKQKLSRSMHDYRTKYPSDSQSVSEMLKAISRRADGQGLMKMSSDLDLSVKRGTPLTDREFWTNVNGSSASLAET